MLHISARNIFGKVKFLWMQDLMRELAIFRYKKRLSTKFMIALREWYWWDWVLVKSECTNAMMTLHQA